MENQFSNFTQYPKKGSSPKKRAFIYVGVFVILIAGAILLGNYLLSGKHTIGLKPIPTPTLVPTSIPTPTITPSSTSSAKVTLTPTPTAKLTPTPSTKVTPTPTTSTASKTLEVEVLNGSGTSGEAVKGASLLKAAGYSITSTGNADAFTYQQTTIQIKKSKASFGAQLKKDLSTTYTVDPTIQTLAETSSPDAIVILGAK